MRLGIRILLLVCLLWQQLLVPLLPSDPGRPSGAIEHVWVHAEAVGHHHHTDGDLHMEDGLDAPTSHGHLDTSSLSQWAVLIPHQTPLGLPGAAVLVPGTGLFCPGPVLDSPLRPPRPLI
ncbi:hypothetical protein [Sphaerotilus montanus]|uniref:hypothetical protein n=1 Tax=Sphaerotilus montanus TaxID=522889 RepID=UPI003FA1BC22